MRLLIAEDERDLAEALSVFFEKNQFTVDTVCNGFDAYEYAVTGDYDAIVLDVMMPKLSGVEVLERLRAEGVRTPVMMLTAKAEKDDRITGFNAGADDYLPKPFAPDELICRVRAMLRRALFEMTGPVAIRYPRGKCEHTDWQSEMQEISIGKGRMLKDGNDIAVLSLGPIGNDAARAIDAAEKDGISAAHYDMVFLKPLDEELVKDVATKFKHIITVEDGCITGGLGTAVMECVNKNGLQSIVHRVGIPDRFVKQGTVAQLYKQCGMDSESIKELIISLAGDSKK